MQNVKCGMIILIHRHRRSPFPYLGEGYLMRVQNYLIFYINGGRNEGTKEGKVTVL